MTDKVVPTVPDAWLPIVTPALEKLSALGAEVLQCKEKFGELRVYTRPGLPPETQAKVDGVIASAAATVLSICAACGAPATLRSWVYAVCDEHIRHFGAPLCAWPRDA